MQCLTKKEQDFCGEMETGMENKREQIGKLIERATPEQVKLILKFLRTIIK